MTDIVRQAKDVLGVEDEPQERKQELDEKKQNGDDTDRDRKELHELEKKLKDEN